MADGQLSQTINLIAEELSTDECKTLRYLCGNLAPHCCVEDVRGMLKSKINCGEVDRMFLLELMLRMRRFDILKKVLRTNKQEAERMLGKGYAVSEYRVLMADVSEDLGKEDLSSLIFLLSGKVPRGRLDKATIFLDVVVELEMLDQVSCEKVDLIYECLRNVHRMDLAKKVQLYQRKAAGETSKLNDVVQRPIEKQQCLQKVPSCVALSAPPASPTTWHRLPQPWAPENIQNAESETGRQYCQAPVEKYRMQAEPRGVCVIIDCVGSDGDMLEKTFRQLHFRVILHKWPSVDDTLSILREVSQAREHQGADAFVCCILSRATASDLLATESWGPGLQFDTVRHLFNSEACPWLTGKPKLFFIQSYSVPESRGCCGFRDEDLETDGPTNAYHMETIPTDADVVWSLCRTDARQLESSGHQSVYMQAVSAALLKGQKRGMHLVDIHTEVNRVMYDHNQKHLEDTYHDGSTRIGPDRKAGMAERNSTGLLMMMLEPTPAAAMTLPAEVREKLAELELELSEGKCLIYQLPAAYRH
ncbi:hypothetical protein AAFF_G00073090 [Aldrovandia affinis]|uniref:CASP8 and FADD-like apoptosis regulator n=1 Tax=Aldrovandia affinis TaxID=143900 RepID=A0AAD7RYG0_9TELE|nr:hypothetical protein AAFF_G00073090 [Aldrovandia affinis]